VAEQAQAGAAVEHHQMLAATDFHTRGVAAVAHGIRPRARDAAAYPPEPYGIIRMDQGPPRPANVYIVEILSKSQTARCPSSNSSRNFMKFFSKPDFNLYRVSRPRRTLIQRVPPCPRPITKPRLQPSSAPRASPAVPRSVSFRPRRPSPKPTGPP